MPDPTSDTPETRLNDGEGLRIATAEDFGINRDSGELLPIQQRIPGTDIAIECKPIPSGARNKYNDVFDGADPDAERVAELFQEFVTDGPDPVVNATPEIVEEGIPYGYLAGVIQALKNSSGADVFTAVEEQRNEELAAQMGLLETMGTDDIETLAELGQNASENGRE